MTMKCEISLVRKDHAYQVIVDRGLLNTLGKRIKALGEFSRVFVLCDQAILSSYGKEVLASCEHEGLSASLHGFELTESNKNLETVQSVYQSLLAEQIDRQALVVSVGGGVAGDLFGFVAATILRGVPFVQVPTTLLAQVDASMGGKVGVNVSGVKNIVGNFHQPLLVAIDPDVLKTISQRQFYNGLFEVLKYGVIHNDEIFNCFESHLDALNTGNEDFCNTVIEHSVRAKADFIVRDEREAGVRAFLNFGHTLGHAIELEVPELYHGEAVGLGMSFATCLSFQRGLCEKKYVDRLQKILEILSTYRHEISYNSLEFSSIWQRMLMDKKRGDGELRMVLIDGLESVALKAVTKSEIKALFEQPKLWWR